jgi:hypothetical protein
MQLASIRAGTEVPLMRRHFRLSTTREVRSTLVRTRLEQKTLEKKTPAPTLTGACRVR